MNERTIAFTFGGITLSAVDYSITAKDKLMQLVLIEGVIKTINVGRIASQIKITGQLPACECAQLFDAFEPLVGAAEKQLELDGTKYTGVTLDSCIISPSKSDGFARFTLEFHF